MLSQRKAQAKRLDNQPLMQPGWLFFRFDRRAFYAQAGAFQLNLQVFLAEPRQRKGDAVMVIVAFLDVIRREPLTFISGLQGICQFVKTDPLTQQGG